MQVEPEEGVMGDRPECRVFWGSRVTPEESIPMHAGTGKQSVFEHVDRRTELLPQSGAERRLHQLFSHNVCSFLLLFSQCSTKSGEKMSSYRRFCTRSCVSFLKRSVHLPIEGSVKSVIRREVFCPIRVRTRICASYDEVSFLVGLSLVLAGKRIAAFLFLHRIHLIMCGHCT